MKTVTTLSLLFLMMLLIPVTGVALPSGDGDDAKTVESDSAIKGCRAYIGEQTTAGRIKKDTPGWKSRLPKFPRVTFQEQATYVWKLKTNHGEIEIEFLPKVAPNHVANYIYLTELGFFDGLIFHRVIPGFMAQGGCPQGSGRGNPGYRFEGEFDAQVRHDRKGLLSMANAGPGTDGSQFFLTFVATPHLDGKHTIFGRVRSGHAPSLVTLAALEKRGSRSGRTTERVVIEKASLSIEMKPSPKKTEAKKPEAKKDPEQKEKQ